MWHPPTHRRLSQMHHNQPPPPPYDEGSSPVGGMAPPAFNPEAMPPSGQPGLLAPPTGPSRGAMSVSSNRSNRDANAEYAECPICYNELYKEELSVLTRRGKRVCTHFYHTRCSIDFLNSGIRQCPVCRADFDALQPVPDVGRDPRGWFRLVDLNGDGHLDQKEVVEVLKAALPIDWKVLEHKLPEFWGRWDRDGNGTIEMNEMMDPQNGLVAYVRRTLPHRGEARPPDLKTHRLDWFRYWDEDNNGTLEQEEVVRALVKTFRMHKDIQRVYNCRNLVMALWDDFDADGNGHIEAREFCRAGDGLADTIIANLELR